MGSALSGKLDTLMELVEAFERKPRRLDDARLLDLHRSLIDGYASLEPFPEQATAMDRRLDDYLRRSEVHGSILRTFLLQFHTTVFRWRAGGALEECQAYRTAVGRRPPNAGLDNPYLKSVIVPQLLDRISVPLRPETRLELLASIARFLNHGGVQPDFDDGTSDPDLKDVPQPYVILGLIQRWESESRANLAERGHKIENRLLRGHHFATLAQANPVLRALLERKGLGYLSREPILKRLRRFLRRVWEWLRALVERPIEALGGGRRALYLALALLALVCVAGLFYWIARDNRRIEQEVGRFAQLSIEGASGSEPGTQWV